METRNLSASLPSFYIKNYKILDTEVNSCSYVGWFVSDLLGNHYANTPMQYTAIFHGCKNVYFQMKIFNIFLIFAQNIDCGYTLEPPQ